MAAHDVVGRTSSTLSSDVDTRATTDNVGKSTLTEKLSFAPRTAPLFEDEPVWEDIEPEVEEIDAPDPATIARLEAAPVADGAAADEAAPVEAHTASVTQDEEPVPSAPPSAAIRVAARAASVTTQPASAPATDPHHAPFEHAVHHASAHNAKRDKLNRKGVVSHHATNDQQISRPGVRFHGHDEFHLSGDYAYRYVITSGSKAEVVDKIWEHDLQHGHEKDGGRLAVNPAHTRVLHINGHPVECVLTWSGGQSAAWMAISDLKDNHGALKRTVNKLAKKWDPAAASRKARDHATEMVFRDPGDRVATADTIDQGRYIVPGQKGKDGNEVGDYLTKKVIRRETPATPAPAHAHAAHASKKLEHGATVDIPDGMRGLINIAMNLPHDRTPPVAVDVANPGDHFFVPKGGTYRREISMYKRRAKKTKLRQVWVYGFVGRDEGGRKVADPARRGWVPLRTIRPI